VIEGTLATLAAAAAKQRARPPALLIVGEVVRLRRKLALGAGQPCMVRLPEALKV